MTRPGPKIGALLELWLAHRELSRVEWVECRQTLLAAATWLVGGVICAVTGWLSLNAALFLVFRELPLGAVVAVAAVNLLAAIIAGAQVRRLLRRPFFALTQREAARDVELVLEVGS